MAFLRLQKRVLGEIEALQKKDFFWAIEILCSIKKIPYDYALLHKEFLPPYTIESLMHAAKLFGMRMIKVRRPSCRISSKTLPSLALTLRQQEENQLDHENNNLGIDLIIQAKLGKITYVADKDRRPITVRCDEYAKRYTEILLLIADISEEITEPDEEKQINRFGFGWFISELKKYKSVWCDVLIASLVLQLLALATPLFTQVIIDKIIVHHSMSSLVVIGIGLAILMIFSAILNWARQCLILHTGNRVDAVLAMQLFTHLFSLPPRYFEHRPTGVITARLQGVETIREFIASAAVSLILDLPFLIIFVAMMMWYSASLTAIALSIMGVIVLLSLLIAPDFQKKLSEQFTIGARNQAFLTEHIAGLETVKSLQMEPLLKDRYANYLADYLNMSFKTKQLANMYNTLTNALEQLMRFLILMIGAYTAMQSTEFTIGMLVAFQMFLGNLSGPVMRLAGLWQQLQQAKLSVSRLGDVMQAPTEPYTYFPERSLKRIGKIEIADLSYRYASDRPWLYREFNLTVEPGHIVAILGQSGSGKSTLAKILQGFYQVENGSIKIDGININQLSANNLRSNFGVVPQETVLFSGTVYSNLQAADPHADFDKIIRACILAEIHQDIEQLPNGYKTEIGERGAGLSGGQRQRLAIARALLKEPPILIFDEATSALDKETAEKFAKTINQLRGRISMLFITHAIPQNLVVDKVVHLTQNNRLQENSDSKQESA